MTITTAVLLAGAAAGALGAAPFYGARRWRAATTDALTRLGPRRTARVTYDPRELAGLPAPVARYFRTVLRPGCPMVTRADATWTGEFRTSDRVDGWRPFEATQAWTVRPAGFVWDATIRMAPGVPVRVRDAFVDGHGSMRAAAWGLVTVVDAQPSRELDAGALQRHLGEAVWFPTALLPSQGVVWTPLTNATAHASLTVADITVGLDVHFDTEGRIDELFTAARFREVNGRYVATPWRARVSGYHERGGLRVPHEGEVEWRLSTGPLPYWRGRLDSLVVEHGG
jgi:hypothetical protein